MELLWWREEHPCCGGKSDALLVEIDAALADVPAPEGLGAIVRELRMQAVNRACQDGDEASDFPEWKAADALEGKYRFDPKVPEYRPMDSAPRDGRLIRLRMGAEQDPTVGWWHGGPPSKGVEYPWAFIDRYGPGGAHFLNRAVEHLPLEWAPL